MALLERDQQNNCPAYVRFWYNPDRGTYKRMSRMMMHHTHALEISADILPGGMSIFHNAQIMKEIHMYTECGVPTQSIHELISEKYHIQVSFDEVYRAAL